MTLPILLAVFSTALLNSLTPGPSMFLVLARTSAAGPKAGLLVTAGVVSAQMTYLAVAGLAMASAKALSPQLFTALQLGGAVLLVSMAYRLLKATPGSAKGPTAQTARCDYVQGVLVGFANPFNLVFMFGVLPQVVPDQGLSLAEGAWIALTVLVALVIPKLALVAVTGSLGKASGVLTPWITRGAAVAFLAYAAMAVVDTIGA